MNGDKYSLTHYQRNFKNGARFTIAALATALSLGGAFTAHSLIDGGIAETQEALQQDDLMESANNIILDCVFGKERSNIDNPAISYQYDKHDGSTSLIVTSGKDEYKKVAYSYSNYLSIDRFSNAKEISSLIEKAMDVYYEDSASRKAIRIIK